MTAVTLGHADETGLEGFCIPRTFSGRSVGHARLDKTRSARWPVEGRSQHRLSTRARNMTDQNRGKVWRMPDLHDAEMLKGDYLKHAVPWHAHAEMCLGLVLEGAVSLRTRIREGIARGGIARGGSFGLINAEEPHQGASVTSLGWRCREIHVAPEIIEATARELGLPRRAGRPLFSSPTFDDAELWARPAQPAPRTRKWWCLANAPASSPRADDS